MMPRISAIICTRNRERYLEQALASLDSQSLPSDQYEVIVVDNASTDGTRVVAQAAMARSRNVRYVCEEHIGLSWARNRGVAEARARYVAFLDDDARAGSEWLHALLDALEESEPRPAAVGGRVWLAWNGDPPAWLPRRYWSVYTFLDHGDVPVYIDRTRHIVGANMAFVRQALTEAGGFNVHLGRQGRTLLSGEEAAVIEHLQRRGLPVLYAPRAEVWHAVDPSRLHRHWLINRMFWDGASHPILKYGTDSPRSLYLRQSARDLKTSCRLVSQMCADLTRREPEAAWQHGLDYTQRMGRIRTHLLLALRRAP